MMRKVAKAMDGMMAVLRLLMTAGARYEVRSQKLESVFYSEERKFVYRYLGARRAENIYR
jgi:hypothetical protein